MASAHRILNEINSFIKKIRTFCVDGLGCKCSDEVFEQIRILHGEASIRDAILSLVIGERLLISFVDTSKLQDIETAISKLILAGVTYRDSMMLNRFRLVVLGELSDSQKSALQAEVDKYERVSLHFFE